MSCLLPLIAGICIADPSTLAISADAHYQVSHKNLYWLDGRPYNGALGRIELRVDSSEWRGFHLTYYAGHESYIDTNRDTGYQYVGAGFVFKPFARGR